VSEVQRIGMAMRHQVVEVRRNDQADPGGGAELGAAPGRKLGASSACLPVLGAPGVEPAVGARLDQVAGWLGELLARYGGDHRRALGVSSLVTHRLGMVESLELLAGVARAEGDLGRASTLLGAAASQRTALVGLLREVSSTGLERGAVAGRGTRPVGTEAAAWARGYAMSLEESVGFAVGGLQCPAWRETAREEPMPGPAAPLTSREWEVAELIAEGRSNREIAETLVLSVRTVERHIENIYGKLGLCGKAARASVAAYVFRHRQ
jgi:DNA-binding CsgD family transcriptional regulator